MVREIGGRDGWAEVREDGVQGEGGEADGYWQGKPIGGSGGRWLGYLVVSD